MPRPHRFVRAPPRFDLPPAVVRAIGERVLEIRRGSPASPGEVYVHPLLGRAAPAGERVARGEKLGGAILGTSGNGTVVYSPSELVRMNPGVQTACLETEDGGCVPLLPLIPSLDSELAVKQVRGTIIARYEQDRSHIIRRLFVRDPELLALTMLHPQYVAVRMTVMVRHPPSPVDYATTACHGVPLHGLPVHVSHVLFRRMDGCLDDRALQRSLSGADIVNLLRVILLFLDTLHGGGYLHLDIKPANIGFVWKGRGATRRKAFHVGDYGIVTSMSSVHACLAKRGSLHSGTNGFISPLLLNPADEAHNRVYPKFLAVAAGTSAEDGAVVVSKADGRGWDGYFGRYKRAMVAGATGYAKADLHSVGFLLYAVLGGAGVPTKEGRTWHFLRYSFLPRLLYFRNGDFRSAADALGALDGWALGTVAGRTDSPSPPETPRARPGK